MSFSNYLENEVLDWAFTGGAATRPTNWHIALYSSAPSDAGGGTELTGNGYARQPVAFGTASGGSISNSGIVTFSASGGDFPTATHFGVFDALTGGNLLAHGLLDSPVTVLDGGSTNWAVGALDVTLD